MKKKNKTISMFIIIILAILSIIINYILYHTNLLVVESKQDNKEILDSTYNLIKVNSVLYNEHDYSQMNWMSYTPVTYSIK